MHLHLMSLDEGYVNCIEKGPHVPRKAATGVGQDGETTTGTVVKPPSEWALGRHRRSSQGQKDHEHFV